MAKGKAYLGEFKPQLLDRNVRRRLEKTLYRVCMRLNPAKPPITAQRTRLRVTLTDREGLPTADAVSADSEQLCQSPMRCSGRYRGKDPCSKIKRKSLRNPDQPRDPVRIMNQRTASMGIPCDSVRPISALVS